MATGVLWLAVTATSCLNLAFSLFAISRSKKRAAALGSYLTASLVFAIGAWLGAAALFANVFLHQALAGWFLITALLCVSGATVVVARHNMSILLWDVVTALLIVAAVIGFGGVIVPGAPTEPRSPAGTRESDPSLDPPVPGQAPVVPVPGIRIPCSCGGETCPRR